MKEQMTLEKVNRFFLEDKFNCSQLVLTHAAEEVGLDRAAALRIASAFGGGMYKENVCGCVTGALMALGLKYGNDHSDNEEERKQIAAKTEEFFQKFTHEHDSIVCKDLLDKARSEGADADPLSLYKNCPVFAVTACKVLDEIL